MSYLEQRRLMKINGLKLPERKQYTIPKKSAKRAALEKAEKEVQQLQVHKVTDAELDAWFKARRKELTGTCTCGCGESSSKEDDKQYKASICHIFPKAKFQSVATHKLNYIELNFWNGCHSNMDNRSMELWPNMECWPVIVARFYAIEQKLTDADKRTKFYQQLKNLVQCHS
jgi:hypothetical protein